MQQDHVLFLPGLMCDRRLFAAQITALEIDATVGDLSQHDNLHDMAAAVLQQAPQEFALVGLSMGGILAFEIWRMAAARVTHLALLATTPHADTPEKTSMRMKQVELAWQGGLRELAIESLKPHYLAEVNQHDEIILGTVLDMAMDLGAEVFERQSQALSHRADSMSTLATISCPTLIMCGEEDKLCPPSLHELMAARIPGATLTIAGDCGHLVSMERPRLVTEQLRQLLAT